MKGKLVLLAFCAQLLWCCSDDEADPPEVIEGAFDVTNIDQSVRPGDDFYQYAVGNWNASNPGKTSVDQCYATMEKWYDSVFDKIVEGKVPSSETVDELKAVYQLYTDRSARRQCGVSVLRSTLEELNAARTTEDLISIMVRLMKEGHSLPFTFGAIHADISNRYMLQISASGFLPFLTAEQLENPAMVKVYSDYIYKMLSLAGWSGGNEDEIVQHVLTLEKEFNDYSPDKGIIKYSKLKELLPVEFSQYLESLGVGERAYLTNWYETELIVGLLITPEYFNELKSYLIWCYVAEKRRYLTEEIFETSRVFEETLNGWSYGFEDAMKQTVSAQFKAGLGKLYSEQMISEDVRNRAGTMADNIRNVFCDRIRKAAWLTEATKLKAIEKLEAIEVYVGGVRTRTLSLPGNCYEYGLQKSSEALNSLPNLIGQPVSKISDDVLYSTDVNASYLVTNAMCIYTSYMQPPYAILTTDLAAAYATLGITLGHEFSHALDNAFRFFDKDGIYGDWWTATDVSGYDQRASAIVDYYNTQTFEGIPVDGKNTLNETIAELAGISLSFEAMLRVTGGKEQLDENGLTLGQRFFLNYAYVYAGDYSDMIEVYKYDPHIYPPLRVNSTVANTNAWYEAFDIQPSEKSYIAPEKRVGVW